MLVNVRAVEETESRYIATREDLSVLSSSLGILRIIIDLSGAWLLSECTLTGTGNDTT